MRDKYYDDNNCDWFDEEREHRNTVARVTHNVCVAVIWASFFWMWGAVGGVDQGSMSITGFIINAVITACVVLASLVVDSQLYKG